MANGTLAASQIEMLSQDGTGIITITPPATNTNRAITLPDAAGAIVVSGTTPSLNGITFPATQVASADANTLDDYEEGTWTVELYDAITGGNQSPTTVTGLYTKVGRVVFVQAFVVNIDTSGMTGANPLYFSLPFQVDSVDRFPGAVMTDNITFASGRTYAQVETGNNIVRGLIRTSGSNVSDDFVAAQDLVSGTSDFWFSLTYFTD
jgi:hypothetical protein